MDTLSKAETANGGTTTAAAAATWNEPLSSSIYVPPLLVFPNFFSPNFLRPFLFPGAPLKIRRRRIGGGWIFSLFYSRQKWWRVSGEYFSEMRIPRRHRSSCSSSRRISRGAAAATGKHSSADCFSWKFEIVFRTKRRRRGLGIGETTALQLRTQQQRGGREKGLIIELLFRPTGLKLD